MPKERSTPVRVLVVDDSPTARELLVGILSSQKGIQVIGVGVNGEEAVRLVGNLRPDVITMDIRMPVMDGLEATRQIMRDNPTPIVIISGNMQQDLELTFKALRVGALAALNKPGLDDPVNCEKIAQTVRLMADVQVVHHWHKPEKPASPPRTLPAKPIFDALTPYRTTADGRQTEISVVGIASSTGGPSALAVAVGSLPANYPLPILVVQHVSPGFAAGLASWLGTQTALRVEVASHGDQVRAGTLLLAPDDYHMMVSSKGTIELTKAPLFKGLRPSANYLFESMAQVYGSNAAGMIMTGMGDDGANGIEAMYRAGALTIAQDEKSCVVYGMPKEAVQRNVVERILPLEQIPILLGELGRQAEQRLSR